MPSIIQQLKKLKNNPKAGAVSRVEHEAAKTRLLSFIAADLDTGTAKSPSFTTWFLSSFISKPVALGVAILTLGIGSLSTVSAASNSLPGDTLYTVKRMTEEAQLQLASLDRRAVLHTEYAARRLEEATALRQSDPSNEQHLTLAKNAMADYQAELIQASADLKELKDSGEASETIATVTSVQDKIGDMETVIDNNVATSSSAAESEAALAAKQAATQTQQDATNVAVSVHEEKETPTSGRELEEMFRKELGSIESRQTFDRHRIDTLENILETQSAKFIGISVPSPEGLSRMRLVINQTELQIPEAMNGFAAGGYRTAFQTLQGIDTELLTLEGNIAQVEFTVMAALQAPVEPPPTDEAEVVAEPEATPATDTSIAQ